MKEGTDSAPVEDATCDPRMVYDQQRKLLCVCQRGFNVIPLRWQRETGTICYTIPSLINQDLWISEDNGSVA